MAYVEVKIEKASESEARLKLIDHSDNTFRWVDLDAATLESLIDDLADARRKLSEKVSPVLDPSPRFAYGHVETHPNWHVLDTVTTDGQRAEDTTPLALRHSGLGWLLFCLPRAKARQLGRLLLHSAEGRPFSEFTE